MEEIIKKPKACCLLDEFSYYCFQPEFSDLVPLRPKSWFDVLKAEKFDFFLCESVWRAYGSGYNIGDVVKKEKERRYQEMKVLLRFMRSIGLPTIFWNKEDNVHYSKFLRFARLFDYVLTTDVRTLRDYQRDCPLAKKIDVMIFAAQPLMHNPIRVKEKYQGDIFFAGRWYNFPERKKELEELLDLPRQIRLHIYDRAYRGKQKSIFPRKFLPRVRKGITYPEMVEKYKRYPIMLNANSVKGSPTMFSRRVPEGIACGISIISSPSISLQSLFNGVHFVRSREETTQTVVSLIRNKETRERINHNLRRKVWQRHTYFHRVQQMCRMLEIPIPERREGVAILRVIHEVNEMTDSENAKLYKEMRGQTYPHILANIPLLITEEENVLKTLKDLFLRRKIDGRVLDNLGFVAFVYPRNRYGQDYILDSVMSYLYLPDVRVIGKGSVITRARSSLQKLHPENEQAFTTNLHPHTLIYSLKGDLRERANTLIHARGSLGENVSPVKIKSFSVDSFSFISEGK